MTTNPTLETLANQHDQVQSQLDDLTTRLAHDYRNTAPETVRTYVRNESARFSDARVQAFVPVLVERAVRNRLRGD